MKRLLLVLGLSLSVGYGISQTAEVGEYTPLLTENNVVFSIAEGTYTESSKKHVRYFLKYENYSNFPVEISFQKELHYGDDCYGCSESDENITSLVIPANSTLEFNEDNRSKTFYIFVKDEEGWIKRKLTDFQIKNIKIEQL